MRNLGIDIILAAYRVDDRVVVAPVEQRPDPRCHRREYVDRVEIAHAIADGDQNAFVPYLSQSKLPAVLEHALIHDRICMRHPAPLSHDDVTQATRAPAGRNLSMMR